MQTHLPKPAQTAQSAPKWPPRTEPASSTALNTATVSHPPREGIAPRRRTTGPPRCTRPETRIGTRIHLIARTPRRAGSRAWNR